MFLNHIFTFVLVLFNGAPSSPIVSVEAGHTASIGVKTGPGMKK
jgi:hypothetical protein